MTTIAHLFIQRSSNDEVSMFMFTWKKFLPFVIAIVASFQISCKDTVDTSDIYTFRGQTISDYINADSTATLFNKIVEKSKVSDNSKSPLKALLSARGNYTVFVPNNEAITMYLDSIYNSTEWDIDTISQEVADQITQNCIIDHGTLNALLTSDFPEIGAITQATLNDRHILVSYAADVNNNNKFTVILNKKSRIITPDIELTNGYVHMVDQVICPSTESLGSLIDVADNLKIFSYILKETTWADSVKKYRDEEYELYTDEEKRNDKYYTSSTYVTPPHRYYGFMAFTETDSVFNAEWGIPMPIIQGKIFVNEEEVRNAIEAKCKEAYPNATSNDWKSEKNAVNQFISYHLVPFKEPYNLLVRHGNELGYNTDLPNVYTMNLWTYFHVMGKPNRLFKLTHLINGEYRINRHSYYNNGFDGDMRETSVDCEGITVYDSNGNNENNALNGYYYPINKIMLYTDYTKNTVLNERIRYDMSQYFPEMMSNDLRTGIEPSVHHYIPHHPYRYIDNLRNEKSDTDYRTYVNSERTSSWHHIEEDYFAMSNNFDITFKLMPVPYAGTWEIRYLVFNNKARGVAQGYFGTNPDNLIATGLPFDFRIAGSNPRIGSIIDQNLAYDSVQCLENDRMLRNHMYMKHCRTYCVNAIGKAHEYSKALRNVASALRLIVYRGYMEPDKTYYLRFKTVLADPSAYICGDGIELCPKSVYDNPDRVEDVW